MQSDNVYVFFTSKYNNVYRCYLPEQYVANNELASIQNNAKILRTPQTHNQAVLQFIELFPQAKKEEKDAFMEVGYPLLQLKIVEVF